MAQTHTRKITVGEYRREYTVDDVCAGRTEGTGQLRRAVYVQTGDNRPVLFPACTEAEEAEIRKAAAGEHFGWFLATA